MTEHRFHSEEPAAEAAPTARMTPNEALVRRMFDAFKRGDLDGLAQGLDEQVVWHVAGNHVLAGDHRGVEGVLGFLRKVVEETEGTIHVDLLTALGDENYATLFIRSTADRRGKHLDQKEVLMFAVCDGRVEEVWHRGDPARMDPFFAA